MTKKIEPSYQFDVTFNGTIYPIAVSVSIDLETAETEPIITVEHLVIELQKEREWWVSFLQSFLSANTSYFSRPYTVQQMERLIRHYIPPVSPVAPVASVSASVSSASYSLPCHVTCVPCSLEWCGGQFIVHWTCQQIPVQIHIPDEEESCVILPVRDSEIEEWDPDAVPEKDATDSESYPMNATLLLDRQRVKEARLKAKLAVYRAQYQMSRFYDKYGNELSESESESGSESEAESEDVE